MIVNGFGCVLQLHGNMVVIFVYGYARVINQNSPSPPFRGRVLIFWPVTSLMRGEFYCLHTNQMFRASFELIKVPLWLLWLL